MLKLEGMKKYIFISLLIGLQAKANDFNKVKELAFKNGFKPSNGVIKAVVKASQWYGLDPLELAAIGLIETGLGKFNQSRINTNGTTDTGIFQINSVNKSKCSKFDLNTTEGSAFCAAKLLAKIKKQYKPKDPQWSAIYHSKTQKHKQKYFKKIAQVLAMNEEK